MMTGDRLDALEEDQVEEGDSDRHGCEPFQAREARDHSLVAPRDRVHDHVGNRRDQHPHPEPDCREGCHDVAHRGIDVQVPHQVISGQEDDSRDDAERASTDPVEEEPRDDAADHHGNRERCQDEARGGHRVSLDILEVEREQVIDPREAEEYQHHDQVREEEIAVEKEPQFEDWVRNAECVPYESRDRGHRHDEHADDEGGIPAKRIALGHAEEQGGEPDEDECCAIPVEPGQFPPLTGRRDNLCPEQHGNDPDWHIDEEDPVPGGILGQGTAYRRADCRRKGRKGHDDPHRLSSLLHRDIGGHHGGSDRGDHRSPEGLEYPGCHQQRERIEHVGEYPAGEGPEGEDDEP